MKINRKSLHTTADRVDILTDGGSPTIDTIEEFMNYNDSSGYFDGGILSDATSGNINISEGSGMIRTTTTETDPLLSFKFGPFSDISITSDTTKYVYIDYNNGSPVQVLSDSEFDETTTKILIGVATNEAGSIESVFNLGVRLQESIGQAGRFIRRVFGISRDDRRGGLILGETGTRNITLTEGHLWWGRTDYTISGRTGGETFDTYFRQVNDSGWNKGTATAWDNLNYDDNSGTLDTLGVNRWGVLWFYLEPDDHIVMIYGRDEHNTQAQAENQPTPSTLPPRLQQTGVLIAKLLFKQNAADSTIETAFTTVFSSIGVTDHGNLANLEDTSDHEYAFLHDGTRAMTGNLNPNADGTLDLGTQTTAQWANVWTDLINGGTLSGNNSGDQDLSGFMLNTGDTTTGDYDFTAGNLTTTGDIAGCEFNSTTIYTDIVTNGDFATGDFTGWSNTTNWSAATNAAVTTNPSGAGDLQSDATIVAETVYRVTYTLTQTAVYGDNLTTDVTMGGLTLANHSGILGPTVFVHHIYTLNTDKLTFEVGQYYETNPGMTIDDVKIETVTSCGLNTTNTNYLDGRISGDFLALDVDTVAGKPKFQMNILPNATDLTIGDASNRWGEGHILDVYSENIYSKLTSDTRMYFTTSFGGRINFENDGVITYYFDKTGVTVNPGTFSADFLVLTGAGQMFKIDGSSNEVWIGNITSAANRWEADRSGNTIHKDGRKANFGTGSDFSIQHNNTNAILNNTTGEIQIQDNGTPRIRTDSTGMAFFNTAPIAKPTVASDTLANLYTAIRALGLVV